ncbi:putative membrane protein [Methanoregula formicica SMSP]|uniref:Putative membrane protein n=1 Tax=Methanoregula formicica (strain DSM 22288 / NBRC 105244 / SMSP) TaxID=593750 RepID=L0HFQ5_METFS|nr:putative membrane protein [Methanoregula formicica SMSP]
MDLLSVLAGVYLCLNLIAALAFARDKSRAKRNTWRTSENLLLVLAFLGPFGAFLSMQLFHHKTRKLRFLLVPVFLILHGAVILYLLLILRL